MEMMLIRDVPYHNGRLAKSGLDECLKRLKRLKLRRLAGKEYEKPSLVGLVGEVR